MHNDFFINSCSSAEFGVRLLSTYTVGGTGLTRTRQKLPGVAGWIPTHTEYKLRTIKLPMHLFSTSPRRAAEQKSRLDAALLAAPLLLTLPNGMHYMAEVTSFGDVKEETPDGCILSFTHTLVGYACDRLLTIELPAGGGTVYVGGTAPEMGCRFTCTVGEDAASYTMAGVTWTDVKAGDVLVVDSLDGVRMATRNGANDFASTDIITWPHLTPDENRLTCPDAMTVEYRPVWL